MEKEKKKNLDKASTLHYHRKSHQQRLFKTIPNGSATGVDTGVAIA